ncbi:XdhC family protein [Peristeroidobacter soli]|uniref:XdhC family protein n=1 Tax=Peristeroidobacter soli TaxID=2497877 RepID=UPI001FEA315C|nr:XdhC family protein [Peristeroidobacter soli]
MEVLLLRVGPDTQWQPLAHLSQALLSHTRTAVGIVTESADTNTPVGTVVVPNGTQGDQVHFALQDAAERAETGWASSISPSWKLFALPLWLPPRLLLLGAGPDAIPVVDFAARLGWKVTLADHRPAYAQASHFPAAENVVLTPTDRVGENIDLASFSAAVVMSHHLPSDLVHLRTLAHANIPYVGLLGPARRRQQLMNDLGNLAQRLRSRLHSPVGFALGGRTPESIALAIVSQVHAFVFKGSAYQPPTS